MREPVDYRGYPVRPRHIDDNTWFYEQPEGLCICNHPAEGCRTQMFTIPWRKVEAAARRRQRLRAVKRGG